MKHLRTYFVLFFLLISNLVQNQAYALSPAETVGNTISAALQRRAVLRGLVPNDPRYVSTTSAVSAVLSGALTGVAAVAAGATLWPAVAAIGASVAISLAADGLKKWLFNGDGTVTVPAAPAPAGYSSGTYTIMTVQGFGTVIGNKVSVLAWFNATVMPANYPPSVWGVVTRDRILCAPPANVSGGGTSALCHPQYDSDYDIYDFVDVTGTNALPSSEVCPGGYFSTSTNTCVGGGGASPGGPVTKPMKQATDEDLTPLEKAQPVSPELMTAIVNQSWQTAAAQPGYQGMPYDPADPITPRELETQRTESPTTWPPLGDVLSPAEIPATTTKPATVPVPTARGTVTPSASAPAGAPKIDLGTDPGIGPPSLGAPPSGPEILSPLTNLMPEFKHFSVPGHASTCPTPSMDLYGKHLVLDGHCNLIENNKATLQTIMLLVWVFLSIRLILSA